MNKRDMLMRYLHNRDWLSLSQIPAGYFGMTYSGLSVALNALAAQGKLVRQGKRGSYLYKPKERVTSLTYDWRHAPIVKPPAKTVGLAALERL